MLTTHPALRLLLVAVFAFVPLAGLVGGTPSAQAGNDSDGVGLTVDVAQPTASPRPDASCELPFGKPAGHAQVRVRVRHLKLGSLAQAHVHSTPTLLASGTADADGSVVLNGTLPDDLAVGSHSISLTGIAVDGQAFTQTVLTFTVTAGGLLAAEAPPSAVAASVRTAATPARVAQAPVTGPAAVAAALGSEAVALGGVLTVSGLTVRAVPALTPDGGDVILDFTIRNVSAAPITSSLNFWIDNAVGLPIAQVDDVAVADLAAGETRTATATLSDVGQWTVFNGHVTLTPPATVGGNDLTPVSRDAFIIVPPFFLLLVVALAAGLSLAVRFVLRARRAIRAVPVAAAS